MVGRQLDNAVAQSDVLGALRSGAEEDFGRGGVRVLLEKMVLDLPRVVVAEAVGQLDLVERLVQQPMLAVLVPRPRQLVLVEDPELHTLDRTVAHGSRADPCVGCHPTGPGPACRRRLCPHPPPAYWASWPPPGTASSPYCPDRARALSRPRSRSPRSQAALAWRETSSP